MATRRTCDMTTGAQGALTVGNIRDWGCEPASGPDEDDNTWDIYVDFYYPGPAFTSPQRHRITISNVNSEALVRHGTNGVPAANSPDRVIGRISRATPGAYTAALAAWRGAANTKAARQKALADALIAAGIVDGPTLGGTTS